MQRGETPLHNRKIERKVSQSQIFSKSIAFVSLFKGRKIILIAVIAKRSLDEAILWLMQLFQLNVFNEFQSNEIVVSRPPEIRAAVLCKEGHC
jgi:hypothetical protein